MKKICPTGTIFVKSHYKTINGKKYFWEAHCRKSKNIRKSIYNGDEIREIYNQYKGARYKLPKSYNFKSGRKGNQYNDLIGFWVSYWENIFKIKSNISVDFVKVLMMTESTFGKKAIAVTHNRPGNAIGLLQITDYTLGLIQENSKELRNHQFKINREDLFDPVVNIAVAVRWIYRKRQIARYYLKKEPTPLQLAEEYKGIRNDKSVKAKKQRDTFSKYWKEYKNAK